MPDTLTSDPVADALIDSDACDVCGASSAVCWLGPDVHACANCGTPEPVSDEHYADAEQEAQGAWRA